MIGKTKGLLEREGLLFSLGNSIKRIIRYVLNQISVYIMYENFLISTFLFAA